ncbi:hypothetical protein V1278_001901 [Bradyrhizobium sp. AZCC 1577]
MIHYSYSDPVPAITEQGATGVIAEIFADIRSTLDVEVVNLFGVTSRLCRARSSGYGDR